MCRPVRGHMTSAQTEKFSAQNGRTFAVTPVARRVPSVSSLSFDMPSMNFWSSLRHSCCDTPRIVTSCVKPCIPGGERCQSTVVTIQRGYQRWDTPDACCLIPAPHLIFFPFTLNLSQDIVIWSGHLAKSIESNVCHVPPNFSPSFLTS